ncbi:sodium:proton antiporter [Mycolicibacterium sp. 018/SC-01/001]|nr:sodium:proton antiporter [Mycolicibacterium sp. 018/SC-01/001]
MTGPVLAWSLLGRLLRRWAINGQLFMVAAGAAIGWWVTDQSTAFFDSKTTLYVAEAILALLLFVDATGFTGSLGSHLSSVPVRLLAMALPLSLAVVIALAVALPLNISIAGALALSCICVTVDFSPQLSIIEDTRIPARVREWLGIESGYNDGLVSPVLLAALALSTTHGEAEQQAAAAFVTAAPAGAIAIVVGALVGTGAGWAMRWAQRTQLSDVRSLSVGVLVLPLLTFAVAIAAAGNGFVAAFVCGVSFRRTYLRNAASCTPAAPAALAMTKDVAGLVNLELWLAFGLAGTAILAKDVQWWPAVAIAVCVLTFGRILPVALSLIGSPAAPRDRLFMGVMGPRGAASIVFGLIAYNALPDTDGATVLAATCIVVMTSVVLHGALADRLIEAIYGNPTPSDE